MSRTRFFLALIVLVIFLDPSGAFAARDWSSGENPWVGRELTPEALLPSLHAGCDYLIRHQLADGSYLYYKDPRGRVEEVGSWDLTRHHGAVYALLRAYQITGESAYLESAERGIEFAEKWVEWDGEMAWVQGFKNRRSSSGCPGIGGHPRWRLSVGEIGFLLIDTALYDHLSGTDRFAKLSRGLATFFRAELTWGGELPSMKNWGECQALIGLAFYQALDPDPIPGVIETIRAWLNGLVGTTNRTHWTAQLLDWYQRIDPDGGGDFVDLGVANGRDLVRGLLDDSAPSRLVGSRRRVLKSTSTSARSEGLIAIMALARRAGRVQEVLDLRATTENQLRFVMQFQYGQEGAFYEGNPKWERVAEIFAMDGGVVDTPKTGAVRVDHTSHHLRAIVAYLLETGQVTPVVGDSELFRVR